MRIWSSVKLSAIASLATSVMVMGLGACRTNTTNMAGDTRQGAHSDTAVSNGVSNGIIVQFADQQSASSSQLALGDATATATSDSAATPGATSTDPVVTTTATTDTTATATTPPTATAQSTAPNLQVSCVGVTQDPGAMPSVPGATGTNLSEGQNGRGRDNDDRRGGQRYDFHHRPGQRGNWGEQGGQGTQGNPNAMQNLMFVVNLKDSSGQVIQTVSEPVTCPSMAITLPNIPDGSYDIDANLADSQSAALYHGDTGAFSVKGGVLQSAVVLTMSSVSATDPNAIVVTFPKDLMQVGAGGCNLSASSSPTSASPDSCHEAVSLTITDAGSSALIPAGTVKVFAVDHKGFGRNFVSPVARAFHNMSNVAQTPVQPLLSPTVANGIVDLGNLHFGLYRLEIEAAGYLKKHVMLPVLPHRVLKHAVQLKPVPSTQAADQASCVAAGHYYNVGQAVCVASTNLVTPCSSSTISDKLSQSSRLSAPDKQTALTFMQQNPTRFDGSLYAYSTCFTSPHGFVAILKAIDPGAAIQRYVVTIAP